MTPGSDSNEISQNFRIDRRKLRTIADIWLQLIIFSESEKDKKKACHFTSHDILYCATHNIRCVCVKFLKYECLRWGVLETKNMRWFFSVLSNPSFSLMRRDLVLYSTLQIQRLFQPPSSIAFLMYLFKGPVSVTVSVSFSRLHFRFLKV